MSVPQFIDDPITKNSQELMQVPGVSGFQALDTGLHWKIMTNMTMIAQAMVNAHSPYTV